MITELRAALFATSIVGIVVSLAMLVPAATNLATGHDSWRDFLAAAAASGCIWVLVALATRGPASRFSTRFGIILVNMLWWVVPVTSIAPLVMGPAGLSVVDAVFESASGFTTTGSTVLTGLDELDHGTLLWRSMTQWLGGTGILSLGLIMLPFLNAGGLQLFRMENSDRSEKVLPRFAQIVKSIVVVYVTLTAMCALAYILTGMSGFDAVNHAMTTISTGGFSTHDSSMGFFSNNATLWVGSLFMAISGLPFTLFVGIMFLRQPSRMDPQILWFLWIIAAAVALLLIGRDTVGAHSARSIAEDVFDVISVITTTGFAAGDYVLWGTLAAPLFFLLTFFGGCAGSTAGGLKIYRLVVLAQMIRSALNELVHPNGVFPVRYGKMSVDPSIFRSAVVMTATFSAVIGLTSLALGALGNDFLTALSGAVTALANVGPGLGDIIGPSGTFASLSDGSKLVLAAAMIAGRLEVMVFLALFMPALWR